MSIRFGLIGDHDATITAHRAIPAALELCGKLLPRELEWQWLPTEQITEASQLGSFHGLWCTPGSPYRSMVGALQAIRFARENGVPFLGTCGGFQHALIEYARNVLGWREAEHAETTPDASLPLISPLSCSLVEKQERVTFARGSRIATAYRSDTATEGYHCRYGLNRAYQQALLSEAPLFEPQLSDAQLPERLRAAAYGAAEEVRAIELDGHPFFVATLFQSERVALTGQLPPLVAAWVQAAAERAEQTAAGPETPG